MCPSSSFPANAFKTHFHSSWEPPNTGRVNQRWSCCLGTSEGLTNAGGTSASPSDNNLQTWDYSKKWSFLSHVHPALARAIVQGHHPAASKWKGPALRLWEKSLTRSILTDSRTLMLFSDDHKEATKSKACIISQHSAWKRKGDRKTKGSIRQLQTNDVVWAKSARENHWYNGVCSRHYLPSLLSSELKAC